MITRSVRKETNTIAVITLPMMGMVRVQANSSRKLKLKMVWLSNDSAPTHFAAATMMEMMDMRAKGATMYIIIVLGIKLVYLQVGAPV